MLPLLAVLALAADPAPDWAKSESQYLSNIRQLTQRFRSCRRGLLLARRQDHHLPGRGEGRVSPAIRSTRFSRWTWPADSFRRVSPGVGKTTCSFFRPDGKKIIFASSHLDPDAKKQVRRGIQAARGRQEGRQPPPLPLGLRPVHGDLRGQPRRRTDLKQLDATPTATTPRAAIRPTASRSSSAPTAAATRTWSCTSWTPTARTSAS